MINRSFADERGADAGVQRELDLGKGVGGSKKKLDQAVVERRRGRVLRGGAGKKMAEGNEPIERSRQKNRGKTGRTIKKAVKCPTSLLVGKTKTRVERKVKSARTGGC